MRRLSLGAWIDMEITVGPVTLLLTYQHVTSVTWKKGGETTCFVGVLVDLFP